MRRPRSFGFRSHVAVVVVQVSRSGGGRQTVEGLIAVRKAALRRRAITDDIVRVRLSGRSGVCRGRQSIASIIPVSMRTTLIDVLRDGSRSVVSVVIVGNHVFAF